MRLLHGDCLERLKEIKTASVDMVLADLPYGTTACKWDSVIPFEPLWSELNRVSKPTAAMAMFATTPFTASLLMSNAKNFRHRWIWNKNNSCGFATAKIRPFQVCEDVLVFGKRGVVYFPQMEVRGGPRRKDGYSKSDAYGLVPSKSKSKSNTYYPKNLLNFSNAVQTGKVHPTQKPVALLEYLIKTYTLEGDTVLDPTMGSGSTGVAALNLNRKFIGIEKDATYFKIAQERCALGF